MIVNSNDGTNLPHKSLLTNRQVQILVKLLQIIYQLISSYVKLNHLKRYSEEDILVDFLVHN